MVSLSRTPVTPPSCGSQNLGDDRVPLEVDLGVVERALLHDLRCAQLVAAMDHRDLGGELGQEDRLLHGGVAAADDHQLLVAEEESVAGGAGGDSESHELRLGRQTQELGRGAGGDDQGVGGELTVALA